ncbi:hypothetical protein [Sulfitobacter sp.]|uniref:hypothetical protein n=1 Tax=Sulfitobacter sp. TaxID=1903071 RepID=UPI00300127B9
MLVRDLRSEGRLSQISIEDSGSALGWELPLDAICINGSYAQKSVLIIPTLAGVFYKSEQGRQ